MKAGTILPLIALLGLTYRTEAAASQALHFTPEVPVDDLCQRVEALLSALAFDSLDATEAVLRDPNVRLIGGISQLYAYYDGLAGSAGVVPYSCHSAMPFEQKRALLEQWVRERPRSVAAAIALSELWSSAGWEVRGGAYSNQVSQEQWRQLADDLREASTALNRIETTSDPHSYLVQMSIARGQPDPRAALDAVYAAAIKRFPTYFHYYSQRANLLQERWYGNEGELGPFASSLLDKPGGDAGLVAYSFVTYNLMHFYPGPTLFRNTGLSWPIVQKAYATRERLYGLRNRDWNALLNLSLAATDRDAARRALEKVGERWDPAVWRKRQYFDDAVKWVNANSGKGGGQ